MKSLNPSTRGAALAAKPRSEISSSRISVELAPPLGLKDSTRTLEELKNEKKVIACFDMFFGSIWIPVSSLSYATNSSKRGLSKPLPRMRTLCTN